MPESPGSAPTSLVVVRAAALGAVGSLPIVGPMLSELVGTFIPDVRFRRLERLVDDLKGEVDLVADQLDGEYVRREEFATLFEDALERATQARNDQKTGAFAAFMAHSMVHGRPPITDRQRYLDILDELRPVHLRLLAVLAAGSAPQPAGPDALTVGQAAAAALTAVLAKVDSADWQDLADLERRGLVRPIAESSLLIATNVRNALLPLGVEFASFVAAGTPAARKPRAETRRTKGPGARTSTQGAAGAPAEQAVLTALRLAVLRELRSLNRRQARSSVILGLELEGLAERLSQEVALVQDVLVDLLAEGLAEPYASTFGNPAESGSCRITEAGMQELARLEAQ